MFSHNNSYNMLYILILLLTFQSVLSSYTSCVQSIFDYEDAYYKMKLNLMGISILKW